jgi:hypothetical protein
MNTILLVVVVIGALIIAALVVLRPGWLRGDQAQGRRGEGAQTARIQQLRRSLMSKAMGDASKVNAWVEYERSKAPTLSEEDCYVRANERWERDNR